MALHKDAAASEIHIPYAFRYADSTARLAAVGFTASDVGKAALQDSPFGFFLLTGYSPIAWSEITGGGAHQHDDSDIVGFANSQTLQQNLSTKIPMIGFPTDTNGAYTVDLTYDHTLRQITLTPTAANFIVYVGGKEFTKTTESLTHVNTDQSHYFYYNESGVLTTSTTAWDLLKHAPICFVFQDTTNNLRIAHDERHHARRDVWWHKNQHANEGTKTTSSIALSNYILNNGSTNAAIQPYVPTINVEDEDITVATEPITTNSYCILFRSGASSYQLKVNQSYPWLNTGTAIRFNEFVTGAWQETTLTEDYFVNYYLVANTSLPLSKLVNQTDKRSYMWIPGQVQYTSQSAANAEVFGNLNLQGLPLQEWVALYQFTLRFNASNPGAYTNTLRTAIVAVTRIIGNNISISQAAASDHGSLAGLSDDDHSIYDLVNPAIVDLGSANGGSRSITVTNRNKVFKATQSGATAATFVVTGSTNGTLSTCILELTNGGLATHTWQGSGATAVDWDAGVAPTLTSSGVDVLCFYSIGGDTAWKGFLLAKDIK